MLSKILPSGSGLRIFSSFKQEMYHEAKELLVCFVQQLIITQITLAHTFDLSPLILSTRSVVQIDGIPQWGELGRRPGGEIKEFFPANGTKDPFCRQGSNRYFVNRLNDSAQMIDGGAAFAVFHTYRAPRTYTFLNLKLRKTKKPS